MVWITKNTLTKGIVEIDEKDITRFPSSRVGMDLGTMIRSNRGGYVQIYHKPDWHDTKKEAEERAEQMRVKKIAFLEKKIESLKRTRF